MKGRLIQVSPLLMRAFKTKVTLKPKEPMVIVMFVNMEDLSFNYFFKTSNQSMSLHLYLVSTAGDLFSGYGVFLKSRIGQTFSLSS